MRAKGRKHGCFVSLSGLKKLTPSPGSPYPLLIVDTDGQSVFFLCEWYRRRKEADPGRTPDTYLDMLLPWAGFLLRHGYAWNDPPDRVQRYLAEFLREDVACFVTPGGKGEDAWFVETTGNSPLSKSSLGVLLAALTNVYDTLIAAGYYAYPNPLRSQRMAALKREHIRQVKNAGAPDDAGIRGESWQETNRTFPTNRFRQRRGKVWEPEVVLEPDAVHQRMRSTIDFMVKHATFQRDQVILLLLRQTGARPVMAVKDILEALNLFMIPQHVEMQAVLPENAEEGKLLVLLSHEPRHIDELVRESGLPTNIVASTLMTMELKGMIRQVGGMQYVLARLILEAK
jgi:DprA winged helix domain